MIAYLEKYDTTVELPDDINQKDLQDVNENFHSYVDQKASPTPSATPAAAPVATPAQPPAAQTAPVESAPAPEPAPKWQPNFYESTIKPSLKQILGPAKAVATFPETPEAQAMGGKIVEESTFGLAKPLTDALFAQQYKDHPAFAEAGEVAGGLGSLMAAGGVARVMGVGSTAARAGTAAVEAGWAAAERYIPRAIMSGATFGTRTFIAETVKAFQEHNVDMTQFGKDVLKDTAFGSTLGVIGGLDIAGSRIASISASVSSAGALGFLSSKMSGADNREASLNATIWAAFEAVGSAGKHAELRMEALGNLKNSIGEYVSERNPGVNEKDAARVASQFVDNAMRKAGFNTAEDLAKSGPENLLEGIEKVNQAVRTAKVPATPEAGRPALPKLPAPVEPETPAAAAPEQPPQTPLEKAIESVKGLFGIGGQEAPAKAVGEVSETRGQRTYDQVIEDLKAKGHDIAKIPEQEFPQDLKDVYHFEQGRTQRTEVGKGLSEISDRLNQLGVRPEEQKAIFDQYALSNKNALGQPLAPSEMINAPIEDQYRDAYKALAAQRGIDKGDKIDSRTMEQAQNAVDLINGYYNPQSQLVFDFAKEHQNLSDHDVAQMAYNRGLIEEPNNDLLKLEIQKAKQEKIFRQEADEETSSQIPQEGKQTPPTAPASAAAAQSLEVAPDKLFPGPVDPSFRSITSDPSYVNMRQKATEIAHRYAKVQNEPLTPEYAKTLFNKIHDILGEVKDTRKTFQERMAAAKEIQAKYPDIEKDFLVMKDQVYSDTTGPMYFEKYVKGRYVESEAAKPSELPVMKEGSRTGEAHAILAYKDNFGPGGAEREVFNIYGDPNDPKIKKLGWGSSVPKEVLDQNQIPVVGKRGEPPKPTVSAQIADIGRLPGIRTRNEPKPTPRATEEVASRLKESADEIVQVVNPTAAAPLAAQITRESLGKMARSYDVAEASLSQAKALFEKMPQEANLKFIDNLERGQDQSDPKLNEISNTLRKLLDDKRKEIQALGTGKMQSFIENYFPHIWDQGEKQVSQAVMKGAKRPFEGSKSFMKKRTIEFTKDGIEMGLTPVSYNPVDLALLKIREMDKYLAAHSTINEYKKNGLAKYVKIGGEVPDGWIKIDDRMSTVFKSPMVAVKEAYDEKMMQDLNAVAKGLGIEVERNTRMAAEGKKFTDAWGLSQSTEPGQPGKIQTRFAGPESALAHEIGHQIDNIYGLQDKFLSDEKISKELTDLANERTKGSPSPKFKAYIQTPEEKMAVMLEAYIHAPDLFKEKAPTAFAKLDDFLKSEPKLQPLTEIKPSLVLGTNESEVYVGGSIIAGHIYAQPDAARLINNYLSPGLQKSQIYQTYRLIQNAMQQFQLGFSAFHLGFTSVDASVSKFALALMELSKGNPMGAIKDTLAVPFAPVTNIIRGEKLLKAWRGEGQAAVDEVLANVMASAGGRARQDQFYATTAYDQLKHHFQAGNVVRGILHIPMAIADLASKPILEYIVPRQKLGIFADLVQMELNHHPDISHAELRAIAQKAWDSVDNRMGQLVYDNLFWNRTFKDLLMASVRSVGWNLGTIRELVGGGADYAEAISNAMRGKKSEFTSRMAYFTALPIVVGTMGAIYQYLRTGKGPQELKDYWFPKTGGVDSFGHPARAALPSYMKDVYHYKEAPLKTILDKQSPIISMLTEMWQNKDFYGVKIRNEDDALVKQVASEAAFMLKQAIPFSIRNMQKNFETENKSLADTIGPWVGVTPAPYDVDQTKADKIAHEIAASHQEIGGRTEEQAERSKLVSDLTRQYRRGDPAATDNLYAAYQKGLISHRQMQNVIVNAHLTPLQRMVKGMTVDEAERVYKASSDEEKAQIERMVERKRATHMREFMTQGAQ